MMDLKLSFFLWKEWGIQSNVNDIVIHNKYFMNGYDIYDMFLRVYQN